MKIYTMLATIFLLLGISIGFFVEHRLDKPISIDCEVIDYSQVETIVAKQVAAHSVPAFDVDKIKHVKSFTYAPVFQIPDTCIRHIP